MKYTKQCISPFFFFLAVLCLRCCMRALSSCRVGAPHRSGFFPLLEHGSRACGLQQCGSQAELLHTAGGIVPEQGLSLSPTHWQENLIHCPTKEVPKYSILNKAYPQEKPEPSLLGYNQQLTGLSREQPHSAHSSYPEPHKQRRERLRNTREFHNPEAQAH